MMDGVSQSRRISTVNEHELANHAELMKCGVEVGIMVKSDHFSSSAPGYCNTNLSISPRPFSQTMYIEFHVHAMFSTKYIYPPKRFSNS